jgi:hypothetical protein
MRYSQYLDAYLDHNAHRLATGDLPITIGTFLNYRLRGSAKDYMSKYIRALHRSCLAVGAVEMTSKNGRTAYVRPKDGAQ